MRFVVYGAGAVGGVVAARLHRSGHPTVAIARGAHLQTVRRDGLRVASPEGVDVVDLPVVGHPAELSPRDDDVVLLAMKSQDTVAALEALEAAYPAGVPVVCVQNGVDNERQALRRFPDVYGVCVMFPAVHLEPGVVEAYSAPVAGLLDVGRYPSGVDATAEAVAAAFRASTFESQPRPDVMRWKYRKLLMNLGNAVEAVCGEESYGSELLERVRAEGEAVLRAAGIPVASAEEDAARRGDLIRLRPVEGRRRQGGSSWQSLRRGTGSIETDHLNGEVVLLGRLHGVATPVNALLAAKAADAALHRRPPGETSEAALLQELSAAD